ncbi:type II secretion system secretin GspD [Gammaproteobacteria bacterium]|nr:type II secretion system secretin GspD [Gammaproteobacteria bacterium]
MARQLKSIGNAAFLGVSLALATLPAVSQNLDQEAPQQGIEGITLNFRDADLQQLVDVVSRVTGMVFILSDNLQGRVTVVSGRELSPEQLYDIFLSVLDVNGYAAVPSGEFTKILRKELVRTTTTPTVFGDEVRSTDEQITRIFQIENGQAGSLAPLIQPLLPPTAVLQVHQPTNTIMVTDSAGNISRVQEILNRLDQSDSNPEIRVIYLKHAQSERLAGLVQSLLSNLNQGGGVPGQSSTSIQADSSINALIVRSSETDYATVAALVEQLDVRGQSGGNIRVIPLRYAKATEIVETLTAVIGQQDPNNPQPSQVMIQADEASNALIVRANAEQFADIEGVLADLDSPRQQVLVETVIAEVSEDKTAALGVRWQGLNNRFDNGDVGGSFGDTTALGEGNPIDNSFNGLTLGFLSGQVFSQLTGGVVPDLQMVVQALRQDSNSNVLSTPNILTLENEEAEIVVGQEVPFITSTETVANGQNQATTNTAVERKTVGLTLKIKPQINEGDEVRLEIEQETSNVTNSASDVGAVDIITNERTIKTVVQVADGDVIVLGGLSQDDTTDTITKIPGLGDLPLIGGLFRSKQKSAVKRNLIVFLRPRIIRNARDVAETTKPAYERLRIDQSESMPGSRELIRENQPPILPTLDDYQNGEAVYRP